MFKKYLPMVICVIGGLILGLLAGFFFKSEGKCVFCYAMNGTYEVGHITAKLRDGMYSELDSDSRSMTEVRIPCLPVRGSLNGDNEDDAAIILMSRTSGQVPSFYVAAALGMGNGAEYTNTVYIGDGVNILGIEADEGIIWVFTLERREGESQDIVPSIERVRQYIMRDGALHEIA